MEQRAYFYYINSDGNTTDNWLRAEYIENLLQCQDLYMLTEPMHCNTCNENIAYHAWDNDNPECDYCIMDSRSYVNCTLSPGTSPNNTGTRTTSVPQSESVPLFHPTPKKGKKTKVWRSISRLGRFKKRAQLV